MTNKINISFDCLINIPKIFLKFEGHDGIILDNHSSADIDLEPGIYNLFAAYQMIVGDQTMDFTKEVEAVAEKDCDYIAKICPVLKSFTFLKKFQSSTRCC